MKTKKMIAAATMAALAVPTTALATGPGHDDDHGKRGKGHEQRSDDRGDRGERGDRGHRGDSWVKRGRKAFVLTGVDASGLTVTDGKLTGAITLDPTAANRGARALLDLTKQEIAGEDTVSFGTAGDAVRVRYRGLTATDALQPTDRVSVLGKIRDGVLDLKAIKVSRAPADDEPAPAPSPQP